MFNYNDYELISLAQEQNEDAIEILYQKYQPIISKKSKKFYNLLKGKGIELCDLIQECYIALDYSIKTFNQDKDNMFYTYLNTCLDRQLIDQCRKNLNLKNKLLNESLPLETNIEEENNNDLLNIIEDNTNNPERELFTLEDYLSLQNKIIDKLTPLEECVFLLKIQNFDYKEIANILDKDNKSIDNTIQRIKVKIRSFCI